MWSRGEAIFSPSIRKKEGENSNKVKVGPDSLPSGALGKEAFGRRGEEQREREREREREKAFAPLLASAPSLSKTLSRSQ